MDNETLVLANVLLFALYASVMMVNARIVGSTRGAMWFAASNLCRGVSMLLVGVSWVQLGPQHIAAAVSAVLAVTGTLFLHHAFAELLERGMLLRGVQYGLVTLLTVGVVYFLVFPDSQVWLSAVLCGTLGVQFAVIAVVVFRFSGEEYGPAGWLTSLALVGYSAVMLLRAVVGARHQQPTFAAEQDKVFPIWLTTCLLTSAATAFGFMSLTTAKLRVELLWRAQVDELTGLLNRWALKRMTMKEIQRCKRKKGTLAVLMMDLDGMKEVNDSSGHGCGDVVLQSVAGILQETIRTQDAVGRMGGDEFCVLLTDTTLSEALVVAERLRAEVEAMMIQYRGARVQVRASLGVTSSEFSGLTWQALIDHSDAALYRAKRYGRNTVVASGAEDAPASARPGKGEVVMMERRKAEPRDDSAD